jgi:hypothetical protein
MDKRKSIMLTGTTVFVVFEPTPLSPPSEGKVMSHVKEGI